MKKYNAMLFTDDGLYYTFPVEATSESRAVDAIINILELRSFIVIKGNQGIRSATVKRFAITIAPSPEEMYEEAQQRVTNYLSNKKYDYDTDLLVKVYEMNSEGKFMSGNPTLQRAVDDLTEELRVIWEYVSNK